mmetsp:Transcript_15101/g.59122  ORF Transcript_15101/g.59122 Transcript_15101/m.59122 type:complete len:221 (-) Transcript_15101:2312-2974(-)
MPRGEHSAAGPALPLAPREAGGGERAARAQALHLAGLSPRDGGALQPHQGGGGGGCHALPRGAGQPSAAARWRRAPLRQRQRHRQGGAAAPRQLLPRHEPGRGVGHLPLCGGGHLARAVLGAGDRRLSPGAARPRPRGTAGARGRQQQPCRPAAAGARALLPPLDPLHHLRAVEAHARPAHTQALLLADAGQLPDEVDPALDVPPRCRHPPPAPARPHRG